jgi:hypothetical protein
MSIANVSQGIVVRDIVAERDCQGREGVLMVARGERAVIGV